MTRVFMVHMCANIWEIEGKARGLMKKEQSLKEKDRPWKISLDRSQPMRLAFPAWMRRERIRRRLSHSV